MSALSTTYRTSLALLTDLYEITMAYGYWRSGRASQEAIFHVDFRTMPFEGGYAVACGLSAVLEFVERFRFTQEDLAYLGTLTGADGPPLFDPEFLSYLGDLRLECEIDGVPEGTVVFGYEPLLRVQGPIIQAQLLETAVLNLLNFQTLIATKAARVCLAARGEPVLEFGLRRAQGVDGGLSASRAAYVGGCTGTSNVLAGRLYGIPVKGTHAHSWVMSFDSEIEAFEAYAEAMPGNCILLVDTYDTLEGVRNAIRIGVKLRERGQRLLGVRLDSGDLAYLSIEARRMLDAAGLQDVVIVGSGELDEEIVSSLKAQGAAINVWGVGTQLVTGGTQAALGGVYKLSAVRSPGSEWEPRIKLSEQSAKISTPGKLQVRRFSRSGEFVGDMVFDEHNPPADPPTIVDPLDHTRRKRFRPDASWADLLVPVWRGGSSVYQAPSLEESRARTLDQLSGFHDAIKRLVNPHRYPVGLERRLHERRTRLILEARGETT